MSSIAKAAADALAEQREAAEKLDEQERQVLVDLGRDRLARMFGTRVDVAALKVEATDLEASTVVLSDGDVPLAVTGDGDVRLVDLQDGQWTDLGVLVPDLPTLGAVLAEREA